MKRLTSPWKLFFSILSNLPFIGCAHQASQSAGHMMATDLESRRGQVQGQQMPMPTEAFGHETTNESAPSAMLLDRDSQAAPAAAQSFKAEDKPKQMPAESKPR